MAWRFGRRIVGFDTVETPHVTLWHDPRVTETLDIPKHLELCRESLTALVARFGFRLEHPLEVFVFRTMGETTHVFGRSAVGRALREIDGIAIDAESLQREAEPAEVLRHEAAHLLSLQWGGVPRRSKRGIRALGAGEQEGKPIDFQALLFVLADPHLAIAALLDEAVWSQNEYRGYATAGSFTGYLTGRFGLDTYKAFYRRADEKDFTAVIDAAYRRWDLRYCIETCEALDAMGRATPRALWFAAWAHRLLGRFDEAVGLLQRTLAADDAAVRPHRATLWLELGQLYDLQGRRADALGGYEKAVDPAETGDESSRAQARRHLEHPFREGDR